MNNEQYNGKSCFQIEIRQIFDITMMHVLNCSLITGKKSIR